jgi:hypothetical protein
MTMKHMSVVCALLILCAASATAGEIFGSISSGGKAVEESLKVDISIGEKTYSTVTDKFGAFRLVVKEKGKCTITVHYKGQTPSFKLVSYDKATRYDLILEKKDGQHSLRRK